MNQIFEVKNVNLKKEKSGKMGLVKKIFLAIGFLIFILIITELINAARYSMVVNIKDGENIMGVNPLSDNLDFGDLSRNNGMTRYVTLKSGGSMPTYVSIWKFGEISDLVKVDKDSFTLEPGEERKVGFDISIPNSAQARQYSGWVWIFRLPKII
jgi:hypothetical protein